MPKLVDALWAGSGRVVGLYSHLDGGDSAATSAITGLKVVGREAWGVFPLKGKMLNVPRRQRRQVQQRTRSSTAIKKILGLEQGKVYKDLKSLRYGRVMVMADQDLDGSHVKGLSVNLFPQRSGLASMKAGFDLLSHDSSSEGVSAGRRSAASTRRASSTRGRVRTVLRGWTLKYYKGLGTSTPAGGARVVPCSPRD
jgi:DNA topoisomerase-2